MILQALADYYERKSSAEEGSLPAFGFESKSIPVIVEIDATGRWLQCRVTDAKSPDAVYVVPQGANKTSGVSANLLWDTAEYALGIDTRGKPERVYKQHQHFRARVEELSNQLPQDEGLNALLEFLNAIPSEQLKDQNWDALQSNPNVSFQLAGDHHLICQRPNVIKVLKRIEPKDEGNTRCLVSGEKSDPTRVHAVIKRVWNSQTSGARIVSFNEKAFESYGKSQGENATISNYSSFAFTTALNHLLAAGSQQRFQVGDTSTVFWAAQKTNFENQFGSIFSATPKTVKDDPDAYTQNVISVLNAANKGTLTDPDKDNQFYILGLAPNAARIAIRFWHVGTVADMAGNIAAHFHDLEITRSPRDIEYLPLFYLLLGIAAQGKADNIPQNLAGDIMRSVLEKRPYPRTLLASAIRRCIAEQSVPYTRAAIIKACLNRLPAQQEKLAVALDQNNENPAYLCGRLFAVLEKTQEEANPGINATIRDRYYGSASSTPVSAFPTLLKLKNHHLKKLNLARGKNLEKLLGEIMDKMPNELPRNLTLADQGRFAIGYYQQRQDLFTKKVQEAEGESA